MKPRLWVLSTRGQVHSREGEQRAEVNNTEQWWVQPWLSNALMCMTCHQDKHLRDGMAQPRPSLPGSQAHWWNFSREDPRLHSAPEEQCAHYMLGTHVCWVTSVTSDSLRPRIIDLSKPDKQSWILLFTQTLSNLGLCNQRYRQIPHVSRYLHFGYETES